ncbi:MAG: pyruvate formate lyase family protein, partial [Candidatus Hermodarchaeota archaeon]
MNKRIEKLRSWSQMAIPKISSERALLITEFYKEGAALKYSPPVARAKALQYILERKKICINKDELIVGERGPQPKAAYTYPEVCCHTLEDLETLNSRKNISFKVNDQTKKDYKEIIIPHWQGNTIRDKIFNQVDKDWIQAYEAGVFTEFMEQRAPGHTVAGKNIWNMGFLDFKAMIIKTIDSLDFYNDKDAFDKREQLKAMVIAADAIIAFAKRYAEEAKLLAQKETNFKRKRELDKISMVCSNVPANAPRTFWEALQHYWFIHLVVITEYNTWDSFNPGRLDQHLYPFFKNDILKGELSEAEAIELLQAFWIKFNNQPAPPKVGVTAEESSTYVDFCNINIGGLNQDGTDGVNELSYILLDVIEEMHLIQPSTNVQISKDTPNEFLKQAIKVIKVGFGQPSVFNT